MKEPCDRSSSARLVKARLRSAGPSVARPSVTSRVSSAGPLRILVTGLAQRLSNAPARSDGERDVITSSIDRLQQERARPAQRYHRRAPQSALQSVGAVAFDVFQERVLLRDQPQPGLVLLLNRN